MTITITLPLPPKILSPNAGHGGSRRAAIGRHAAYKKYRDNARTLFLAQVNHLPPLNWPTAMMDVKWYGQRSSWLPDRDNVCAMMKGVQDAVQLTGIVVNDSGVQMVVAVPQVDKANPRVVVTVRKA